MKPFSRSRPLSKQLTRLISLLALALTLLSCSSQSSTSPTPDGAPSRRVLFIGNSFTYYNGGVDACFEALTDAAHPEWRVTAEDHTFGDCSLLDHYSLSVVTAIEHGEWDLVVLQEHSRVSANQPQRFLEGAAAFDRVIESAGAQTLLCMVHPWRGDTGMYQRVLANCGSVSSDLNAPTAPCGVAWTLAGETAPEINLYAGDGYHPSAAGTYLDACVYYSVIWSESPAGIVWRPGLVTEEDALALQGIAWEAAQNYLMD